MITFFQAGFLIMGDVEEQGFVIRDKRGRSEEKPSSPPPPEGSPSSQSTPGKEGPDQGEQVGSESRVPLNFSSFIFSLGSSSLMLMGETLAPEQPSPPVNLSQAKEIIDILSMLEEKTEGNLSSDEKTVLQDMLYTLRMKFVDVASGKTSSVSS